MKNALLITDFLWFLFIYYIRHQIVKLLTNFMQNRFSPSQCLCVFQNRVAHLCNVSPELFNDAQIEGRFII